MYEPCRCYTCACCQQRRERMLEMSKSMTHDEQLCEDIIPFISNTVITKCLENLLNRSSTNYRLIRQVVTHLVRPIYEKEWRLALMHDNFIAYEILRMKESPDQIDMRELYYKYEHHKKMIAVCNCIKYGPNSPAYREVLHNFQNLGFNVLRHRKSLIILGTSIQE